VPKAVKQTRPYDSPHRREQAAATRRAILDAAQLLFERDEYAATSVPAIAAEAGVALKTVYVAFETKANLLSALWEARFGADEQAIPLFEREWYRNLLAESDPERKLRLLALQSREVKTRSGALLEVIRNAASVDVEIASLWTGIQAKLLEVQRSVVEQLAEARALSPGLDVAKATDILWTLNHPTVWHLLVRERGWAPEEYERWLGGAFSSQLLPARRSATIASSSTGTPR
jgi:AcrR family transcriptional regulator